MSGGFRRSTMDASDRAKETDMFQHPDVTMALAHQREHDLIAEAERQNRLTRILRASAEDERGARAPARKPATLHPLVFWAMR
jgi:hypothetical protein